MAEQGPSVRDLLADYGEFLLMFSRLESALAETLRKHDQDLKSTFSSNLDVWKSLQSSWPRDVVDAIADQADMLRRERNLIVHGLAGAVAQPAHGGKPVLRVRDGGWRSKGPEVDYDRERLRDRTYRAELCGNALRDPAIFARSHLSSPDRFDPIP